MGFYCLTMLAMALELAQTDPVYEDMASKFFEHFIGVSDAMNSLGGTGLWDKEDGFYYDQLRLSGANDPVADAVARRIAAVDSGRRSRDQKINKLPIKKRMSRFSLPQGSWLSRSPTANVPSTGNRMLAIPNTRASDARSANARRK